MVLRFGVMTRNVCGHLRQIEDFGEIQALGLPMIDALLHVEPIAVANEFIERTHAKLRHQLARFFCNEEEVVNHMLRLTGKALAQLRA